MKTVNCPSVLCTCIHKKPGYSMTSTSSSVRVAYKSMRACSMLANGFQIPIGVPATGPALIQTFILNLEILLLTIWHSKCYEEFLLHNDKKNAQ